MTTGYIMVLTIGVIPSGRHGKLRPHDVGCRSLRWVPDLDHLGVLLQVDLARAAHAPQGARHLLPQGVGVRELARGILGAHCDNKWESCEPRLGVRALPRAQLHPGVLREFYGHHPRVLREFYGHHPGVGLQHLNGGQPGPEVLKVGGDHLNAPPVTPFSAHSCFSTTVSPSIMREPGWLAISIQAVNPFLSSPGFATTGKPTSSTCDMTKQVSHADSADLL